MESTANAGRRISSAYNQAAEAKMDIGRRARGVIDDVGNLAVKYAEHQEISKGAAEAATVLYGLDQKWNERIKTADPNDPTTAAKFREEVIEPTLEKLKGGFFTEGGQRFGESKVQSFRNHFFEKTTGDMARLAGIAAKQNVDTLTNQLTNAAMSDPTSLGVSLDLAESSIAAMVDSAPTIGGANASALKMQLVEEAKKQIIKAAAVGAISENPEAGLKKFSDPKYAKYISGTELKQLEQQARTVERAKRVDENYRLQNQKLERNEASDAAEGAYLERLHSDDPKKRASVSATEISRDYTLTREARERMIGLVQRETEPDTPARVSNATAADLISRIRAPVGDPRRITSLNDVYDALEKKQLNKADFKFVRDEFTNLRTPEGEALGRQQDEFVKSVKHFMTAANPMMGKLDPSGDQKVYEFTIALQNKIAEYRKSGKDPRDLMDPSKPDYMGGPAALAPYQKTLQQSLEDTARSMREGMGVKPAAAPAARNDVMPAIPPPDQRAPGSLYETPKGTMKWTGTGWVKP